MEVKVLFPPNKEIADLQATICAAAMRSTRTKEPAHEIKMKIFRTLSEIDGMTGEVLDEQHKIEYGCRQSVGTFITDENVHSFLCSKVACGVEYLTGRSKLTWNDRKGEKCEHFSKCATRMLRDAKRMKHWGVFEFADFTVSVSRVSRALTHQLVRHRLFSYLQQSQRAVEIDMSKPWYVKPKSIEEKVDSNLWLEDDSIDDYFKTVGQTYERLIRAGVPDEDARFILPNACFTHITIKGNARNWLHFFRMRLDPHAQWEIREMAQSILGEFMKLSPIIFEGAGELNV
jgi:thymidylate synthase (FAD)